MNSASSPLWLAYTVTGPDTYWCACSTTREAAVAALLKELSERYTHRQFTSKDIDTRFLSSGDVFEIS